jgi:hypothetical protein
LEIFVFVRNSNGTQAVAAFHLFEEVGHFV